MTLSIPLTAFAQDEAPVSLGTIEVTGSSIKRTDIESALPVQVINREDIERSGATTASQLLGLVSANLIGATDATSVGNPTSPGFASANLRGLGSGSTLVLINGRRAANYAFDGSAVDLNSIPLAAVQRVEILKDGASAIYGADAVAGVINFILRKDYTGAQVTANSMETQHGGGDRQQATASFGYGNLGIDRFNVFATFDWQRSQALAATARPYSRSAYIPGENVNVLTKPTFPANVYVNLPNSSALGNPSLAAGCAPPNSLPDPATGTYCRFDYLPGLDILPATQQRAVVAGATVQLDADTQWFTRVVYGTKDFTQRIAPSSITPNTTFSGLPPLYPAGGPYYPSAFAAQYGLSGDLALSYRTVPLGPRINDVTSSALFATTGIEGAAHGWDYDVALTYSRNEQRDNLISGYVSEQRLLAALYTGQINPFGTSGPVGNALLQSTQITPDHQGRGSTVSVESKASRTLFELPSGDIALALGAEMRHESLSNDYSTEFHTGEILGDPGNELDVSSSRNVGALFAEMNIPFYKTIEAQLAARYDHYSDFGGTLNPKVALRWQPVRELLFRSSWGTGFRAPALYDLHTPQTQSFGNNELADPLRCPVTGSDEDCNATYTARVGGNPDLKPEKSQQFNAGVVWAPSPRISAGADYWKINKSNTIGQLDGDTILANYERFAQYIVRGPPDAAYPSLPGPITYIDQREQNLGDLRTSGIDVSVALRSTPLPAGTFAFRLDGTYVIGWTQQLDGVSYTSAVGHNVEPVAIGAVPRWRHYVSLHWNRGPFGATLAQAFSSAYTDVNPGLDGGPRKVGVNDVWNVQGTYDGIPHTTLVLGVRNLMDRAPPFSNQTASQQLGYDPRYGDPLGRVFYASVTYRFR
ncbi:MAG: TonB-dependent receptor [Casimicrobiaceae bacterium]